MGEWASASLRLLETCSLRLNGPCPTKASLASSVLEDMWAINARTEEAGHEQICSMRRRDHIKFIKKGGCSGWLTDRVCVCVCVCVLIFWDGKHRLAYLEWAGSVCIPHHTDTWGPCPAVYGLISSPIRRDVASTSPGRYTN